MDRESTRGQGSKIDKIEKTGWFGEWTGLIVFLLIMLAIFTTVVCLDKEYGILGDVSLVKAPKAPLMSEAKVPDVRKPEIKSPVLEKALKNNFNAPQIVALTDTLRKKGIKVTAIGYRDETAVVDFLYGLIWDGESQKIFRQFTEAGVLIYLASDYKIGDGCVYVDVGDGFKGVKKVAKWLATGKM